MAALSVASGCVEPSAFFTILRRLRESSSQLSSFQNSGRLRQIEIGKQSLLSQVTYCLVLKFINSWIFLCSK
jgi:hypothetical protein